MIKKNKIYKKKICDERLKSNFFSFQMAKRLKKTCEISISAERFGEICEVRTDSDCFLRPGAWIAWKGVSFYNNLATFSSRYHFQEGAFALAFKSTKFPGQLVATRRGSPLLVGIKSNSRLKTNHFPVSFSKGILERESRIKRWRFRRRLEVGWGTTILGWKKIPVPCGLLQECKCCWCRKYHNRWAEYVRFHFARTMLLI